MSHQENDNNYFNDSKKEYFLDLFLLFKRIWTKRLLVVTIFFVTTSGSLFYSFSIPNIYTSTALLAPSDNNSSARSAMGSIGSLASISGIDMPASEISMSQEAVERLKSYDFFKDHFLPYIKLQDLIAIKGWDEESKSVIYNKEIFISDDTQWIIKKPSDQLSYLYFREIFSVTEDRDTFFVTVSIKHFSPDIAKNWLDIIIRNINNSMMNIDREKSKNSIEFLNIEYSLTNLEPLKDAISSLLESQMKSFMMSSINKDYVFKIIESPLSPEIKSSPNRILIFIIGSFLGLFLACLIAVALSYYQEKKH